MRLVKGNKEFLQWWNHWMSRIHSVPDRANNKTPSIPENVDTRGGLPPTTDGKTNRPKSPSPPSGRRTPVDVKPFPFSQQVT